MPKQGEQYGQVLTRMVKKHAKKMQKKNENKHDGIITTPQAHDHEQEYAERATAAIREQFQTLNRQRNKAAMRNKRVLAVGLSLKRRYRPGYGKMQRKLFGTGKSLLKNAAIVNDADELEKRKKRKDALSQDIVKQVKKFYLRGDISQDLPDALVLTLKEAQ